MCCLFFSISIVFAFFCYLCPFCLVLFFFFFKQKAAFERRISYWISDVCSSDLSEGKQFLSGTLSCANSVHSDPATKLGGFSMRTVASKTRTPQPRPAHLLRA